MATRCLINRGLKYLSYDSSVKLTGLACDLNAQMGCTYWTMNAERPCAPPSASALFQPDRPLGQKLSSLSTWRAQIAGLMSRISQIAVWKQIRAENPNMDFDEVSRIMAPADPLNFVDKIAPRPGLMINGTKDDIVPVEANKLLHAMAKEPKPIIWLELLPRDQTSPIIAEWLKKNL